MSFVHLQVKTAYSLLSSTNTVNNIVQKAKEDGMTSLAITDRNVLYGAISFYKSCKKSGIKPIIGLTVDVLSENDGESYPLILLAKNNDGYSNLLKISSAVQTSDRNELPQKWLRAYASNLFAITPGESGEIESALLHQDEELAMSLIESYINMFDAHSFFLSLQKQHDVLQYQLKEIADKCHVPLVATNDVKYLNAEDAFGHATLLAIRDGLKLDESSLHIEKGPFYFKTQQEMMSLYAQEIEAVKQTVEIAAQCHVEIQLNQSLLPSYPVEEEQSASELLRQVCLEGLANRLEEITPKYKERLVYELSVIEKMNFSDYFLIVWDFMKYARDNGILTGPGRGSAAGSLVSYALQITDVDPIVHDLLFERFLNPERITMPDIDIDFPDHRREEVIQYVTNKYGAGHVAQIITFGTLAAKAAARDVARVFGKDSKELEKLSRMIPSKPGTTLRAAYKQSTKLQAYVNETPLNKRLFETALMLEGLPRHTSTHAAGVIIAEQPLVSIIPLQKGHNGIFLTQFPMDNLEEIGLLKMDFLGLRNLSLIERIVDAININTGKNINIKSLPLDDAAAFSMLQKGETLGIFQLESDGMQKVLLDLKPTELEDIVAVNALYRPGPMENIPTYIRRKHGLEAVAYPHEDLQPVLEKTYGVIVYQEQIIQIASIMAGFSLSEADLLRRAVGKKNRDVLMKERQHFVNGARGKGYQEDVANRIYDLIVRFADYGFNRSHAVAYSMIAYQLAYLKANYPLYFMAGLLTSVVGNEDKVAQYIQICKQMNIETLPPSINKSYFPFSVEQQAIRFSLGAVKGVGNAALKEVIEKRKIKPFEDLFDVVLRLSSKAVNRKTLESLILSGALDDFGLDRATLLATIEVAFDHKEFAQPADGDDLFEDEMEFHLKPKYVTVEPMPLMQKLAFEKQVLGVYLSSHPLKVHQDKLDKLALEQVVEAKKKKGNVTLGAYITKSKVIRTKNGQQMCFFTFSDQSGEMDAVVFPTVFQRYGSLCDVEKQVVLQGKIEDRNGAEQMIVNKIEDIESVSVNVNTEEKRLFLRIPTKQEWDHLSQQINNILIDYQGHHAVLVYIENEKQTYRLNQTLNTHPSKQCIGELVKILGENNVVLK